MSNSIDDLKILTPSYKGEIKHGRPCLSVTGCSVISMARHINLSEALAKYPGAPYLWLDDDMFVTDEDIEEMFRVQKLTGAGVVSGIYPIRTTGSEKTNITINQILGTYTPEYSELNTCGAGCMLCMPEIWDKFTKYKWLLCDGKESPPAFLSRPSWDRLNTTEDFDFCLNIKDLGIKIVSANNVSANHCGKQIELNNLNKILEKRAQLPTISCVNNLNEALKATTEIVVIGEITEFEKEEIQKWNIDFGNPVRSPRFRSAYYRGKTITTIRNASDKLNMVKNSSNTFFWDIIYPTCEKV
jgi:hypothetical protein